MVCYMAIEIRETLKYKEKFSRRLNMKILHIQKKCWTCNGTGEAWIDTNFYENGGTTVSYHGYGICRKCDGTGIEDRFIECIEYEEV